MSYMVTGGAGYIGAHVVRALRADDIEVVVVDDLSTGHRAFVPDDVPFVHASILETDAIATLMRNHSVTGVIQLAGYKFAEESVARPLHTYQQNVSGTASVLAAMRDAGVRDIVYSSSAAVYGTPDVIPVDESAPTKPESPYGESKLVGEWLVRDASRAHGFRQTSLRYFNVVGTETSEIFDSSPGSLFPRVVNALVRGDVPHINGDDYPTPDGTCVRDYIHVGDLAAAHVAAVHRLADEKPMEPVYNLGSGDGVSVRQIMDAFVEVVGRAFEPRIGPRRPGDPACIVASGALAARDLNWAMHHTTADMVRSAWDLARVAHHS